MPAKKTVKAKGKAKKAVKTSAGRPDGTRRKRARKQTWAMYIYKVLKHVHEDVGISTKAMRIMNAFVDDIFERLQEQAVQLTKLRKAKTLSSREIQTAIRLTLPGELVKNAIVEAVECCKRYENEE